MHIITLQGHCEWDGQHVILPLVDGASVLLLSAHAEFLAEFLEEGKITQELADEAKKNALQVKRSSCYEQQADQSCSLMMRKYSVDAYCE